MPYATNADLPAAVRKLPAHAQTVFRKAFNHALKEYAGDEKKAYATAWAAAKKASDQGERMFDLKKLQQQLREMPLPATPDAAAQAESEAVMCASEETWDISLALQAMSTLLTLMRQEIFQKDQADVQKLAEIFAQLQEFVNAELDEALAAYEGMDDESRASPGEKSGTGGHGGYLVSDEKGGKHLPTKQGGKVSHRLMAAAKAALTGGYRGKKYQGPGKQEALAKLKRMYEREGMDWGRSIDLDEFFVEHAFRPGEALRMAGETRFTGYAFLWPTDPEKRDKDLLDTYFTPQTDYGSYYRQADVLYHHGLNPTTDLERYGHAVRAEVDDVGLFVECELDKSKRYWKGVAELIRQGKLYLSPGTAQHLLRYGENGEVRSYPIVEYSLTPTPGQPRLHSVAFLRAIGVSTDGDADGVTDGEAPAAAGGQKRDDQKRETRNEPATRAASLVEDFNMEPKELAELVAQSVRSVMAAEKQAADDAKKQAEKEQADEAQRVASEKALVEKITAEVRASLPVQAEQRPALNGVPNFVSHLGEFSYLKAVRGIVSSFWGKPNAWGGAEKERDIMTKYADEIRSTLSENIGNLGAYLVPPQYVQEMFIPLLRSRSVVRAANPIVMQANSNVVYIPSQSGGATAYWVGENATITASNLTVGQTAITIKKLAGLEYVSNELLADSNPSVDQIMRQDLAAVLSLAEDTAYLSSDGTANAPVGISRFPGITTVTCASDSGSGGALQAKDLFYMKLQMMTNNVPNDNWAWFCAPRTWDEIAQLKDGQNRYLLETLTGGNIAQYPAYGTYPTGGETTYLGSVVGRLLGWPVFVTNNITTTQNDDGTALTGSTLSSLYLARMSDLIIAERAGLELMATNVAGTSFATDQTWIRAIMRVGFGIRHPKGVTVMTGLT